MFALNRFTLICDMSQFINELNKLTYKYNISYQISKNDDNYSITINTTNTYRDEYLIKDIYFIILPLTRNIDYVA
jgi:hypothetical protein